MEHTEKLYYAQPPVLEFTARVLECEADKNGWQVVLDRTAFYPEGAASPPTRVFWAARGCWTSTKKRASSATSPTGPSTPAAGWRAGWTPPAGWT